MNRTESIGGVGGEVFKSDFVIGFYNPENLVSELVETHVRAFFGEKMMKPRAEPLFVGRDGKLSPDYIEMMEKSIAYWREKGDVSAVERFSKELEGAGNAAKLIVESSEMGEPLPIVINASDPGDFYVDSQGRKKSVTFIWIKEKTENSGWHYRIYSLPTKYIGVEKHWELLKKFGDIQKTGEILGRVLNDAEMLGANELIATPVLLTTLALGIDEIAKDLGYRDWDEIEKMAADQLALEKDELARERREKIVSDFTMRIFFAVKGERSRDYQEALVAAMSDTMALEAGGEYINWSAKRIEQEIDKNVRLALALRYRIFEKRTYTEIKELKINFGDLSELFMHYQWVSEAFNNNARAQEARATGCGGSGSNYGVQFGLNSYGYGSVSLVYSSVGNLLNEQQDASEAFGPELVSSGEEPEGRYLNKGAKYKPGHCRACDQDREKVWHKADGGCDCCTTCERRLAGGD